MPLAERHVLVCTKPGREWILAKIPPVRGAEMEIYDDQRFDDYEEAVWEVFKRRWKTVTGHDLG
jgi:hypothetical protein